MYHYSLFFVTFDNYGISIWIKQDVQLYIFMLN